MSEIERQALWLILQVALAAVALATPVALAARASKRIDRAHDASSLR